MHAFHTFHRNISSFLLPLAGLSNCWSACLSLARDKQAPVWRKQPLSQCYSVIHKECHQMKTARKNKRQSVDLFTNPFLGQMAVSLLSELHKPCFCLSWEACGFCTGWACLQLPAGWDFMVTVSSSHTCCSLAQVPSCWLLCEAQPLHFVRLASHGYLFIGYFLKGITFEGECQEERIQRMTLDNNLG